jgi:hypothetical protein
LITTTIKDAQGIEGQVDELYRQIGQLKVENNSLYKNPDHEREAAQTDDRT